MEQKRATFDETETQIEDGKRPEADLAELIEELQTRLAHLAEDNARLQSRLDEADSVLAGVLGSRSWRLTAPLRRVASRIRKMLPSRDDGRSDVGKALREAGWRSDAECRLADHPLFCWPEGGFESPGDALASLDSTLPVETFHGRTAAGSLTEGGGRSHRAPQSSSTAAVVRLSAVIPTKNALAEGFEELLTGLRRQRGIDDLEIVVVDSGSSDATVEVARRYDARVVHIEPEDFNHGETRNLGGETASGELLVFMTQDCKPATEDLLLAMSHEFEKDPALAGLSPRQIPRSDADLFACWEGFQHNALLFGPPLPEVDGACDFAKLSPEDKRRLVSVDAVCAMVRQSIWSEVKFRRTSYAEDLLFGLDVHELGYRTRVLPRHAVIHSHTRSALYYLSRYYIDTLTVADLFEQPHPEWASSLSLALALGSIRSLYDWVVRSCAALADRGSHSPLAVLSDLTQQMGTPGARVEQRAERGGEPTLDAFFESLGLEGGGHELPAPACAHAFGTQVALASVFFEGRFPGAPKREVAGLVYKLFARSMGMFLGDYVRFSGASGRDELRAVERLIDDAMGRMS